MVRAMTSIVALRDVLHRLCNGNAAAVALIEGVMNLAEVYDDVIDRDNKTTDAETHEAFAFALFGLHANPVYRENPGLQMILLNSLALWRAANRMEATKDSETLHASYVMRMSPYNFAIAVVMCVAGMENAVNAAQVLYGPGDDDTLASYLREHQSKD